MIIPIQERVLRLINKLIFFQYEDYLGAGLLGLYCCGLLSSHAYNVFCCDKNSKRLRLVTEFGAVPLHPSLIGPVESKANYVIECTGDATSAQQVIIFIIQKY